MRLQTSRGLIGVGHMSQSSSSSSNARAAHKAFRLRKRTEAPYPSKNYKSLTVILQSTTAEATPSEREDCDYENVVCEECGSGVGASELLLCEKCDRGFHTYCLRPILVRIPAGPWFCSRCSSSKSVRMFPLMQTKIVDFFRILKAPPHFKCASPQDGRKRRRQSMHLVKCKKRRRLLWFIPTEDPKRRLEQMASLATALMALQMEFCNELTYTHGMAPRSANQAKHERGGMQVVSKEDTETLELCRDMCKRGKWRPLVVVFDSFEGEGRKKQNLKCLWYNVEGKCNVLLVATRDIAKGDRLYHDYNGYEQEYPTQHFV